MDLTFTDVNRALYDARTVGPSNREHPLQCSLHNLATMGRECDSKVQDALDRQFSTFVGRSSLGALERRRPHCQPAILLTAWRHW